MLSPNTLLAASACVLALQGVASGSVHKEAAHIGFEWRDVTHLVGPHEAAVHKDGRRMNLQHVHEREQAPADFDHEADAYVRRLPSYTSFVYHLEHANEKVLPKNQHLSTHQRHKGTLRYNMTLDENRLGQLRGGALGDVHMQNITLPLCTGGTAVFKLERSNLLPKELAKDYPHNHAFLGVATRDGAAWNADIDFTSSGIRAQIFTPQGICYVDPHTVGRTDLYTVYHRNDKRSKEPAVPHMKSAGPKGKYLEESDASAFDRPSKKSKREREPKHHHSRRLLGAGSWVEATKVFTPYTPPTGKMKWLKFKFVPAITAGYADWAVNVKKSTSLDMIQATFNRAAGIWRREIGLDLEFISDLAKVLPYIKSLPEDNTDAWTNENVAEPHFKNLIDYDKVDMAHYIAKATSGGGGLGMGWPCEASTKHGGATSLPNPTGDAFDVDYVAHEMAHQLAIDHTWSGKGGSCSKGNFAGNQAAMELGSGYTIASYAGICEADNLAQNSLPYFHIYTLNQFEMYKQKNNAASAAEKCGTYADKTVDVPVMTVPDTCTIPKNTYFELRGKASSADAWYNWEQVDPASQQSSVNQYSVGGPLFKSVEPTKTGKVRYFPEWATRSKQEKQTEIDVGDNKVLMEKLPLKARKMHFTLTARTAYSAGGGKSGATDYDKDYVSAWSSKATTVEVASVGPLQVRAPGYHDNNNGDMEVSIKLLGLKKDVSARSAADKVLQALNYQIRYYATDATAADRMADNDKIVALAEGPLSVNGAFSGRLKLPAGTWILEVSAPQGTADSGCQFTATTKVTVANSPKTALVTRSFTTISKLHSISYTFNSEIKLTTDNTKKFELTGACAHSAVATDTASFSTSGNVLTIKKAFFASCTATSGAVKVILEDGFLKDSLGNDVTVGDIDTTMAAGAAAAKPVLALDTAGSPYALPLASIEFALSGATGMITPGAGKKIKIDYKDSSNTYVKLCEIDVNDKKLVSVDYNSNKVKVKVAGCDFYPEDKCKVTVPAGAFLQETEEMLLYDTGVFDIAADTTAPVFVSSKPAAAATGVAEDVWVEIEYDEAVWLNNINAKKFTFSWSGGEDIEVFSTEDDFVFVENEDTVVVTAKDEYLPSNTEITLSIAADAVQDWSKNNAVAKVIKFTTGDTLEPGVLDGLLYGDSDTFGVFLTFDEAIKKTASGAKLNLFNNDTDTMIGSLEAKYGELKTINGKPGVSFARSNTDEKRAGYAAFDAALLKTAKNIRVETSPGIVSDLKGNQLSGLVKKDMFIFEYNGVEAAKATGSIGKLGTWSDADTTAITTEIKKVKVSTVEAVAKAPTMNLKNIPTPAPPNVGSGDHSAAVTKFSAQMQLQVLFSLFVAIALYCMF